MNATISNGTPNARISRRRTQTKKEAYEQEAVFAWAALTSGIYPELEYMFHIPNGGSRNKIEAANLKRQGVKAGVSDIFLPAARGIYHGLFIELKAQGGKPTQKQKEFLNAMRKQGYFAVVCIGRYEAIDCIEKYLRLKK